MNQFTDSDIITLVSYESTEIPEEDTINTETDTNLSGELNVYVENWVVDWLENIEFEEIQSTSDECLTYAEEDDTIESMEVLDFESDEEDYLFLFDQNDLWNEV